MPWTTKSAIKELEELIARAHSVADEGKASPAFMRWYLRAVAFLDEVFGGGSKYRLLFKALSFQASGPFFIQEWDIQEALEERNHQAFVDDLNRSIGIFQAAVDELHRKPLADVYHGKDTPKSFHWPNASYERWFEPSRSERRKSRMRLRAC
jgi:hypothetical protein